MYQKLAATFFIISLIAMGLQLAGGAQWASLIPARVNEGEIWRLLSAHFVHTNWQHYLMNMAGIASCLVVFRHDAAAKDWVYSAIFISFFSSACLYFYFIPWQSYVGFSGVLHGWVVIGILGMSVKEPKLALAILTVLVIKLIYENVFEIPSAVLLDGSRVATESHLFGAAAGLLYGLATQATLRKRIFSPKQIKK